MVQPCITVADFHNEAPSLLRDQFEALHLAALVKSRAMNEIFQHKH
jgi:hypothetical protein